MSSKPITGSYFTLDNYCSLMREIKQRIITTHNVIEAMKAENIGKFLAGEYCYLQLRMSCELIALACLLVHDDVEQMRSKTKRALRDPPEILSRLEKINPDFYPKPVRFLDEDGAPGHLCNTPLVRTQYIMGPRLSKVDLLDLWGMTGDFLHRGTLKSMFPETKIYDFEDIQVWANKITGLLTNHQVNLINPQRSLLASFGTTPETSPYATIGPPAPR